MILVMVVLGGMGSVWGVVLGAMILQLLQSWFLQDLTGNGSTMLGEATRQRSLLQKVDLTQSIELIFGIILVRHDAVPPRRPHPGPSQGNRADLRRNSTRPCRPRSPA